MTDATAQSTETDATPATAKAPGPKQMVAPVTIGNTANRLVLKREGVPFMVQWDLVNKPSGAALVLQEAGGKGLKEELAAELWEDEGDVSWLACYFNEDYTVPDSAMVDLKLNWQERGKSFSLLIFENQSLQDLKSGLYANVEAEEPVFGDEDGAAEETSLPTSSEAPKAAAKPAPTKSASPAQSSRQRPSSSPSSQAEPPASAQKTRPRSPSGSTTSR